MPESKLKEFAKKYPKLEKWTKEIEELTEKANQGGGLKSLGVQAQRCDWAFGCIWGLRMENAITDNERDELLAELEELGRIKI